MLRLPQDGENTQAENNVTAEPGFSHMRDVLSQYMPAGAGDDADTQHVTGGDGDTTLLRNFEVPGTPSYRLISDLLSRSIAKPSLVKEAICFSKNSSSLREQALGACFCFL